MEEERLNANLGEMAGVTREELSRGLEIAKGEGIPSDPLFGVLPLRRIVPMNVHSVLDYVGGLSLIAAGLLARSTVPRVTGFALGGAQIATSAVTDYKLSFAKLVPIKWHEIADYAVGISAMVLPFLFRDQRRRKSAASRWLEFGLGASVVLASLFTDYRAARGRGIRGV